MAPTGLVVKRNIVLLAENKGLKQSDFIDAGISATTVKSVFKQGNSQTPDLDTVNRFAEVMGVDTYIFFKSFPEADGFSEKKREFMLTVSQSYDHISEERRDILLAMCKAIVKK